MKLFIKEKLTFNDSVIPMKTYTDIAIARVGSQDYAESELKENGNPMKVVKVHRFNDEVLKSAPKMDNIPIVENHPADFMDINKSHSKVIGVVTNSRFKDGKVIADLIFYHKPKYNEFSVGYSAELNFKDGKYYQSEITPNHLANLDKSRCGIICSLTKPKRIKDMKVIFNDKEHEVSDAVGAYITVMTNSIEELKTKEAVAFEDGVKAQKDRENIIQVANKRGVTFKDTDTVKDIKIAIVADMGIATDGNNMDFIDGIISASAVLGVDGGRQSVTTKDKFSFKDLKMGEA